MQQPSVALFALRYFRLFDALQPLGSAFLELHEDTSPGAYEALRAWCTAGCYSLSEVSSTPAGAPAIEILTCHVTKSDGSVGPRITVTRYAGVS